MNPSGKAGDNPWLRIPAGDYEGHMASPGVGQARFLAEQLARALARYDCRSLALLGCATGNGLEFIDPARTGKLTALDINPDYLARLRERFADRIPGLETVLADLAEYRFEPGGYSLIFAALVFEYLDPAPVLPGLAEGLARGGVLRVILQLPAKDHDRVSPSPYKSLNLLKSIMKLVNPPDLDRLAESTGLNKLESETLTLPSGKSFYAAAFIKP